MVIYHYVEIIWRILVTPNFLYNIYNHEKNYPGEPANIHIQPLINIIPDNNWLITTKKGKGKLPLFYGNVEQVIPIYAWGHLRYVARHILHMNKLPIDFLPVILTIAVECKFQDVTCSNIEDRLM